MELNFALSILSLSLLWPQTVQYVKHTENVSLDIAFGGCIENDENNCESTEEQSIESCENRWHFGNGFAEEDTHRTIIHSHAVVIVAFVAMAWPQFGRQKG